MLGLFMSPMTSTGVLRCGAAGLGLASLGVELLGRMRRNPKSVIRMVCGQLIVDALLSMPLTGARLANMIVSELNSPDRVGIIYLRLLVIFLSIIKLSLSLSLYMDLMALTVGVTSGESGSVAVRRRYSLFGSLGQQQELLQMQRWIGWVCVLPAGVVTCLHIFDLCWTRSIRDTNAGQVLVAVFYLVVVVNIGAWLCAVLVFRGIQERRVQLVQEDSNNLRSFLSQLHEPGAAYQIDLSKCSETLEVALDECCCICLEPQHSGEMVATLPCSHSFHKACLESWMRFQVRCPMRCLLGMSRPSVPRRPGGERRAGTPGPGEGPEEEEEGAAVGGWPAAGGRAAGGAAAAQGGEEQGPRFARQPSARQPPRMQLPELEEEGLEDLMCV